MQFLSTIYAATLIAMAAASPIEVGAPSVIDSKLQTRALRVDVWESTITAPKLSIVPQADHILDPNKGGRHESLYTEEQKCCKPSFPLLLPFLSRTSAQY